MLPRLAEPKAGKNRMHLDIQVADVHAEVERLVAVGASVVDPPHDDAGFLTAVLAVLSPDPHGFDGDKDGIGREA